MLLTSNFRLINLWLPELGEMTLLLSKFGRDVKVATKHGPSEWLWMPFISEMRLSYDYSFGPLTVSRTVLA